MRKIIGLFLLFGLLFCGCGQRPAEKAEEGYLAVEYNLPAPNQEIGKIQGNIVSERTGLSGEVAWRIVKAENVSENHILREWYIQTIQAPYEKWVTEYIPHSVEVSGEKVMPDNFCIAPEGDIFGHFYTTEKEMVARWENGNLLDIMEGKWDSRIGNASWQRDKEGNSYFYDREGFLIYDKDFKQEVQIPYKGEIKQLVWTDKGSIAGFLGQEKFGAETRLYLFENGKTIEKKELDFSRNGYGALCAMRDNFIFKVHEQGIFFCDTKEQLLDFYNQNVLMEQVTEAHGTDRGFALLGKAGEQWKVVLVEWGELPADKRKELTMVASYDSFLVNCVSSFNRTNPDYRIKMVMWDSDKEYYNDFCTRIQMEISTGKGPDLMESTAVPIKGYGENGFLLPLDEGSLDASKYVPNTLEAGKVNGKYFVWPYRFTVDTLIGLKGILPGKENWNLDEVIQILEEGQVEAFYPGARPWDVLNCLVTMDEECNQFVDWQEKKAKFTEETFLRLLELAPKYADKSTNLVSFQLYEDLKEKKYLVKRSYGITGFEGYKQFVQELKGEGKIIGYPVENGYGSLVEGSGFAINGSTKNKAGAITFLQYLEQELSREENLAYIHFLPANQEIFEKALVRITVDKESTVTGLEEGKLTRAQADSFRSLLRQTRAKGLHYPEIIDLLYEETERYFNGSQSAAQVAEVLNNRVQLYLNE